MSDESGWGVPAKPPLPAVVVEYRRDLLLAAGYEWEIAVTLALDPEVDVARAKALRAGGCPSDLAVRILT